MDGIFGEITLNEDRIKKDYDQCSDLMFRNVDVCGKKGFFVVISGLFDSLQLNQLVTHPILNCKLSCKTPQEMYDAIKSKVLTSVEAVDVTSFSQAYNLLSSGFVLFYLDGCSKMLAVGVQGWSKRKTDEPSNEATVKGAKECFVETLNDNRALLRKRMKTHHLKFKQLQLGDAAQTMVVIAYLDNRAKNELVNQVEFRLKSANMNTVLDYGCLDPFVDTDINSFFSTVANTERPDVLCSKLLEGRVAIIVDGTPFVMYTPALFSDAFSSLDDYNNPPYYATFIRALRYLSFLISLFLPGLYVAVGTFHQELIPTNLLFVVATSEATTPFTLTVEAVMIHILYEIMREAGLRLPKTIGHAVSIIGAIVIGEATVSAGIIGAPMLVIVAVTAISSYVVYPMFESVSVLRILFIIVGGLTGIYGIMLGMGILFVNICTLNPMGVPYSAPISPVSKKSLSDTLYRQGWKKLSKRKVRISDLEGSTVE